MRIIFNTTYMVEEAVQQDWQEFMQRHYIPYLHRNKLADDVIFSRVSIDQPEGKTFSLQIVFQATEDLQHFLTKHLPFLEEKISEKYKNHYLCFSSTLTEI